MSGVTPSLDDDDVTIVRWYECERRPTPLWDTPHADLFSCPWGDHLHVGRLSRRRGSGRRVAAARYHLRKHLEWSMK